VNGDILSRIDEVVNESDGLSDEMIRERARENGLEKVPEDVTEVVDVLFGDVIPRRGNLYDHTGALYGELNDFDFRPNTWNFVSCEFSSAHLLTFGRIAETMSEQFKSQMVYHRLVRYTSSRSDVVCGIIYMRQPSRYQNAVSWKLDIYDTIDIARQTYEYVGQKYAYLVRRVEEAFNRMIVPQEGEEVFQSFDEQSRAVTTGSGCWYIYDGT
jgi:hypothetical protein